MTSGLLLLNLLVMLLLLLLLLYTIKECRFTRNVEGEMEEKTERERETNWISHDGTTNESLPLPRGMNESFYLHDGSVLDHSENHDVVTC